MDSFLNRYRHITVLLLVICAQLVLLAVQVKNDQDVRFIRIWTITAVTPVARFVESLRGGSAGFLHNYITLHDTNEENRRLKEEVGRLKLDNVFLRNELNTADRAKALQIFQSATPSKTLAANVIAISPGSDSKVVTVNRGSLNGVERGMAVVTPDGIVGKVTSAYPTASLVQLVTDPEFAAGVMSQKGQVRGTLKGRELPPARSTTSRWKRRWNRASGSTLPATTAFFRAASRWARCAPCALPRIRISRKSCWIRWACSTGWKMC